MPGTDSTKIEKSPGSCEALGRTTPRKCTTLWATICIAIAMTIPLAANAHDPDPDWERDQHDPPHDQQSGQRAEPPRPAVPGDDRYGDWPDPYAQERRWGQSIAIASGYFTPYQGDGGVQAQFEYMATSPNRHFRIGGEFLYQSLRTRFFDVDDLNIDSYQINLVMHWVPFPGRVTPYLGGGLGMHINDFSAKEVRFDRPFLDVRDDTGVGFGAFGVVGLELPLNEHLAFFAEGRVSLALQTTGIDHFRNRVYTDYYHDGVDDSDTEDMGGVSGAAGLRFNF